MEGWLDYSSSSAEYPSKDSKLTRKFTILQLSVEKLLTYYAIITSSRPRHRSPADEVPVLDHHLSYCDVRGYVRIYIHVRSHVFLPFNKKPKDVYPSHSHFHHRFTEHSQVNSRREKQKESKICFR